MAIKWDDEQSAEIKWDDEQQTEPTEPQLPKLKGPEMKSMHRPEMGDMPSHRAGADLLSEEYDEEMARKRQWQAKGGLIGGVTAGGVASMTVPATLGTSAPSVPAAGVAGTMLGGGAAGEMHDLVYGKPEAPPWYQDKSAPVPEFSEEWGGKMLSVPRAMVHGATTPDRLNKSVGNLMDVPRMMMDEGAKPLAKAGLAQLAGSEEDVEQELGKAKHFGKEFVKSMVRPIGGLGIREAEIAWATDPVGSALMSRGAFETTKAGVGALATGKNVTTKIAAETVGRAKGLRPKDFMERHLKQGQNAKNYDQNINTALEEGHTASESSVVALYNKLDTINNAADMQIKAAAKNGKTTILVEDVLKIYDEMYKKAREHPTRYEEAKKVVDDMRQAFLDHPEIIKDLKTGKPSVPIEVAQNFKRALYRDVAENYGELGTFPIEASKTMARGIKETIQEAVPGLKGLHARESLLLSLEKELSKASRRISKKDLIGIGIPIKLTASMMYNNKMAPLVGIALGLLDSSKVQGRLAIMLQRAQNRPLFPGELRAYTAMIKQQAQKEVKDYVEATKKFMENERGAVGDQGGPINLDKVREQKQIGEFRDNLMGEVNNGVQEMQKLAAEQNWEFQPGQRIVTPTGNMFEIKGHMARPPRKGRPAEYLYIAEQLTGHPSQIGSRSHLIQNRIDGQAKLYEGPKSVEKPTDIKRGYPDVETAKDMNRMGNDAEAGNKSFMEMLAKEDPTAYQEMLGKNKKPLEGDALMKAMEEAPKVEVSTKSKNNASGQTEASVEALGVQKALKAKGQRMVFRDQRTGKVREAIGLRPEDNVGAMKKFENLEIVDEAGNRVQVVERGNLKLRDITGVVDMVKDQIKVEGGGKAGVAKVALKYGIPAAILSQFLQSNDKKAFISKNPHYGVLLGAIELSDSI